MARKSAKAEKIINTPRGPANAIIPLSPMAYSIQVNYGASQGIVRGGPEDWMGPLNPMAPVAPPEIAGRRYDFPVGFNLATTPRAYEAVGFPIMRALADSYDLLRLVIETRKDQVARMRWGFRLAEKDGRGRPKKTTAGQQAKIDELMMFWSRPDGVNRWRPWLRSVLEDKFVVDAVSLYCQRNRGGKLIALKQVDGASIKVVLDDWGRTPQPFPGDGGLIYPPAFQQVLKGLPAVNYSVRDVVYRPHNRRVHKAYGYSEVEQIIMTVNIALHRQVFQLNYYKEGNVPEALIGTPDNWTPEQIKAFQIWWDGMLTGNLANRRHAYFVPGGVAKTFIPTKEPDLKNPLDEWLARVVCFAFSVSPQPFVQQMNCATAGTAQETAKEEGVEPLKEYVTEIVNDVNEQEFGVEPGEIEHYFEEEDAIDPKEQTEILTSRSKTGLVTINEAREDLGEEKSDDPAADQLMVLTANGYVPIGANTPDGKQKMIDMGLAPDPTALSTPPPDGDGKGDNPPRDGDKSVGNDDGKSQARGAGKVAEKLWHRPHAVLTPRMAKAARAGRLRRVAPVPFDLPASVRAESRIKGKLAGALKKIAKGVAAQIRKSDIGKVAKASKEEDEADRIARDADLSAFEDVVMSIADDLAKSAAASAEEALASLGVDTAGELMNQVNEAAVAIARDIGAELVGQRFNEDGELVPAVRAEYRIDESTRDMIRDTISQGLEDNLGNDEIASLIEQSTAFSSDRAELIAHTEIRRANSAAALEGYKGASDVGVDVQKEWLLGEDPCPICEDNADDGPIDLDDAFSSGDDEPPAHPRCQCAIAPVVIDSGDEEDSGGSE